MTMRTKEDKNIPSREWGQVLIQVQLIQSLPFVTTMKKNKNMTKKDTRPNVKRVMPWGHTTRNNQSHVTDIKTENSRFSKKVIQKE